MAILWIFRACFTSLGSKHVGSLLLPPARDWGSSPCEWGLAAVGRFAFCMQQIPHLHLLYTPSCKVAHPFPHFTKEIRASFGNASQNLLLFMQSSKIWMLCKWILFWFFWSLCLRDSVIFAQCAPHVLTMADCCSCPDVQLLSSWCVGQRWAQTLTMCKMMAGVWKCHFSCLEGLQALGCHLLQMFTSDHPALL